MTNFHNFHHLDHIFFESYFPLTPPPWFQPSQPSFFFRQLGSLRAPLWPSGSDQKLQDPYLPARPEFQAQPKTRGTRATAGDKFAHLEKLSWLFLVRKFHIVPKFPRWKSRKSKKLLFFLFFFENLHDALEMIRVGEKKGGIYNAEDRARGVGGMIKPTIHSRL